MTIQAGQQTLNGAQFVAYARAIPDSDFGRIQRNSWLLLALQRKLLDPSMWGQIPQLYAQFNDVIATDLSPEQVNHLACLLQEVPNDAVLQDGVRPEWTSAGPQPGSLLVGQDQRFQPPEGIGPDSVKLARFSLSGEPSNVVSRSAKSPLARPPRRADFATKVGPPPGMIRLWTPLPTCTPCCGMLDGIGARWVQ